MKMLLFCTKTKPYLADFKGEYQTYSNGKELDELWDKGFNLNDIMNILNGKIVAECDFEIEKIFQEFENKTNRNGLFWYQTNNLTEKELLERSGLTMMELSEYLKPLEQKYIYGKGWQIKPNGYATHIKNLYMFDEPRELSEFDQVNNCCFEKEIDKDFEGLPIYACVFTNGCRYQSDGHTCDKHFYPLKQIHNMSKVFDNNDCEWKYVISVSPEEMCKIANKEQTVLVRKNVLKEILKCTLS